MRLAYFSPLPPTQSGIADYSNELLPHLAKRADISLFTDSPDSIDAALLDRFVTYPLGDFPRLRREYDLALYHMGNNVHHETIYEFAIRYPGVVVLHDLFLHHFIGSITFVKGDYASYVRELGYALDSDGLHLFMDIRLGKRRFPVFDVPLCDRIIDRSLALLVHSVSAASAVQNMRPDRPVRVIPALIAEHQGKSLRDSLDVRDETVIFASLGFVNATKQIEMALRQFARLRETRPDIHYVIVGGVQGNFDLKGLVTRLGLDGDVTATGYVEEFQTFMDWTETADIVINLRHPTVGETSAAALRAMAAGKPIIVFDHGWYAELPDEACVKVPPLDEQALYSAMRQLAQDPAARSSLGELARQTTRQDHDPGIVADAYVDFLEDCLDHIHQYKLDYQK